MKINYETALGKGTEEEPWNLKTPPGSSEYTMHIDASSDPKTIVCWVGKTKLLYDLKCLEDLYTMLKERGDWMALGAADEKKEPKPDTVEAWGRSEDNPIGGWYGLRKGFKGRFGMYVPPLMEALGLCELEHNARNNRMKAI